MDSTSKDTTAAATTAHWLRGRTKQRSREVLVYLSVVAVSGMLGLGLGWIIHGVRVKSSAGRVQEYMRATLADSLRGFRIGAQLPEIPLWNEDSNEAVALSDLTSRAMLVVYLSASCGTCLDLVRQIHESMSVTSEASPEILLVAHGPTGHLREAMDSSGIAIQLYRDVEEAFPRRYGVVFQPTYFLVDARGHLVEFGTGEDFRSEISRLLAATRALSTVKHINQSGGR